jgi:CRP-like cAMP-binding protein
MLVPPLQEQCVSEIPFAAYTNRLLDALPPPDLQRLMADCEPVELVLAQVLSHPGDAMDYVYFPTDSVISLVMPIDGDPGLEVGLIGYEGMLGIPLMLGVHIAPFHALVQVGGPALRMAAPAFLRELAASPALHQRLKRYLYVSMSLYAQTAACNRFHVVEKRLACLLLMTRDRAHSEGFHITHELMAKMLGVRRVGVTKAAGSLQKKNLISYVRGKVVIHDPKGLEAASCKCYRADKERYERILAC